MARSALAACVLAVLLALVSALSFELEAGSTRILRHEFGKDTAVVGDYKVTDVPNQRVVVEIRDENGGLIKAGSVEGKLVFTTDVQGMYEFHFTSQIEPGAPLQKHEVSLNLRSGIEAKDYDAVKEKENLQPLELELRRMEELAEEVAKDLSAMKQREAEMRDTNESTNSRVLYFSLFSMACLVALAAWQIFYLKKFFQTKKLI